MMDSHGMSPADIARTHDRDRWAAALFMGEPARGHVMALLALNYELGRVAEIASEPMVGEIRLAWWREALEGVAEGRVRQHSILEAAARLMGHYGITPDELEPMISARIADLYRDRRMDIAGVEGFARDTSGTLHGLWARIAGAGRADIRAAREAGTAWALTGLLRAVLHHRAMGRDYLPKEGGEALEDAVREMAQRARTRLDALRRRRVERAVLPAFLVVPQARDYLKRLAMAGYDPARANYERGALVRRAKLLGAMLRGCV